MHSVAARPGLANSCSRHPPPAADAERRQPYQRRLQVDVQTGGISMSTLRAAASKLILIHHQFRSPGWSGGWCDSGHDGLSRQTDRSSFHFPVCVSISRHQAAVSSNDTIQYHVIRRHRPCLVTTDITRSYLPIPSSHSRLELRQRHNGDVSYTYTGITSSQSSGSDTILCGKKLWSGQRGGGGGHRPMPPPLNTPLGTIN